LTKLAPIIAANSELIVNVGLAVVGCIGSDNCLQICSNWRGNCYEISCFNRSAALKIGYLTLAAATGSATAAQTLAELTYKKSIVALVAYNVAMAAQSAITGVVTAAQYALNLALSLNPIGLVVIAVAALGAAFVLAYKKIEPFRDLMDSIFQKIKNIGTAIKESPVGQAIAKAFDGFRAAGGPVRQGRSYVVGGTVRNYSPQTHQGQFRRQDPSVAVAG
jgi:hypothetical protein